MALEQAEDRFHQDADEGHIQQPRDELGHPQQSACAVCKETGDLTHDADDEPGSDDGAPAESPPVLAPEMA